MGSMRYESAGQKQARQQAADYAAVELATELKELKAQLEIQQAENAKAAQRSTRREWLTITIALLTLAATVLFGILALLH